MPPRILIVEDDLELQRLFKKALVHADFEVFTALNVQEGLWQLNRQLPQMMMLDLGLPDANGLQLLTYVRHHVHLKEMQVVVVSGNHLAQKKLEASYADIFLMKPVDIRELVALMQRLAVPYRREENSAPL